MTDIQKAVELIAPCTNGVVFTGAGISAESGISTYRDPGGLWDTYKEGASGGILAVLASYPEKAPEILGGFFERLKRAQPNPGHLSLVEMEKMGYIKTVITQNVDNLHREAGSSLVYELHGNIYRLRCLECGQKVLFKREIYFELMDVLVKELSKFSLSEIVELLPQCELCGGAMRPDFVGFGEEVQQFREAVTASLSCDLMLIVGTSGVVYPAASLPEGARSKGATLIEINPRESDLTPLTDLFLRGAAGEILSELVAALRESEWRGNNGELKRGR
jgi:NAD-dependent deacetylase